MLRSTMRVCAACVGNDSIEHFQQRVGKLVDVPVGVDVGGRLDRRMTEELLHRLGQLRIEERELEAGGLN